MPTLIANVRLREAAIPGCNIAEGWLQGCIVGGL